MKTLLIDGQWNLKRNFYKRRELKGANYKLCGGTFGFLDSTKSVLNKLMPDRTIVAWDGFLAGKMRYNIYPPYKASRKKNWENEKRILTTEGHDIRSEKDNEDFQLITQKIDTQVYLEELYVRQLEVDYVEADDLIACYILGSNNPDEHIYILSRDQDFYQLISEKVSIISPDSFEIITLENFKEKMGYTIENALLIKCIEGDDSDEIPGVGGVKRKTLFDHYPDMINEKYTFQRLVEEGYKIQEDRANSKPKKKPLGKIDKIIQSEHEIYRNAKLMNLRKPFLSQEAIDLVYEVRNSVMNSDQSIEAAMDMFAKDGMVQHIWNNSVDGFFGPFYSLKAKEKEYEESLK